MKVSVNELEKGIVFYLGFGVDKFPNEHKDNLTVVFGKEKSDIIEREALSLIREANQIPIDWTVYSLSSVGEKVIFELGKRHPELSELVLRAIAWKFTFDWR